MKIEYNDFHAIFLTSIISQIPKIANMVKNNVSVANKIEIPFLNIILSFIGLAKFRYKLSKWLNFNC